MLVFALVAAFILNPVTIEAEDPEKSLLACPQSQTAEVCA